jgi:hypothetical protein
MKKIIGLLLLVAACSPVKKENQEQVEDTVIAEVTAIVLPSLTDAEKAGSCYSMGER